ncbi:MAG: FlgD immunoglobulin-like domain containing protein [Longimicrobiales bacterium]
MPRIPRRMQRALRRMIAGAAIAAALAAPLIAHAQQVTTASAPSIDTALLKKYQWRSIGPDRGGRSIAISGVRGRPKEGYFGATGGGLWKTVDGGDTWAPVTDGQVRSASVGAVAVSESNPDIIWIGMGETCIRGNIMSGDGVYRSTDAGKTWMHIGFEKSENISKIRIHPTNSDIVFVAAFGKFGVPNEERGVFKSTDGGKTWRRVLFRDARTAAIDISIDRTNPNVMYAAMWEAFRKEYQMSSGGPGSGLFKSVDGGETWTEITSNPGMPSGVIGRIGVAVSGADPNRVYALVEHENGGLFSSDDAGATWKLVNSNRNIRQRAFYYTHVIADVKDRDLVYLLNVSAYRSADGGKTLGNFSGGDTHDLWIDPDDTKHVMLANDGGGAVSYNADANPRTWTARDYPTAQYYHVVATAHNPFHVCGAQQDGSTVCLPSGTGRGFVATGRAGGAAGGGGAGGGRGAAAPTTYSPGGAEPAYIAPDPRDPDIFYSGSNNGGFLERTNRRTGQSREVNPYPRMFSGEPASALVERWQWTYPIIFSPVDPTTLYAGSQHVWKTSNGGQSWDRISPDLTRHDPKTMGHSGGPITGDMNGPEVYAVVFAIGPSKKDANVIWAGSDDGLVHVTRNGGKIWTNVTPRDMPDFGRVSIIDASAYDARTAYISVKRPLLGDHAPYIFRTNDYGATWTKIVNGIRNDDYVHAVREDPYRRGMLYAATQHGVYLSYDDGLSWSSLSLNLPDVPVSDLIVEDNDLAISTHGRSFYILDNIAPLRQHTFGPLAEARLFAPTVATRSTNPALFTYWLPRDSQKVTFEMLDGAGTVVRSFTGPARAAGINTFTWDLRVTPATSFPGMILWGGGVNGPAVPPGTYRLRMTTDGQTQVQPLLVRRNPMFTDVTDADLQAQYTLAIRIRDKVSEANQAVIDIRATKAQIADRMKANSDADLASAGTAATNALSLVEGEIYQVRNQSGQDPLNFPIKVNNRLASLLSIVSSGDGRPIANADPIFRDLTAELKVLTDRLNAVRNLEVAAFNVEAKRLGLERVQ